MRAERDGRASGQKPCLASPRHSAPAALGVAWMRGDGGGGGRGGERLVWAGGGGCGSLRMDVGV